MRPFNSPGVTWVVLVCFLATTVPWPAVAAAAQPAAIGSPAPADTVGACRGEGEEFARTDVHTFGNFWGGVGLGLLLPVAGAGIAYAIAGKPAVPYDLVPDERTRECRLAFAEGYQKQGRREKRNAALVGGIVGTGIAVVLTVFAIKSAVITGD